MSYMKTLLQKVSVEMGLDGEVNDKVIAETAKRLSENIEKAQDISKLYEEVSQELP